VEVRATRNGLLWGRGSFSDFWAYWSTRTPQQICPAEGVEIMDTTRMRFTCHRTFFVCWSQTSVFVFVWRGGRGPRSSINFEMIPKALLCASWPLLGPGEWDYTHSNWLSNTQMNQATYWQWIQWNGDCKLFHWGRYLGLLEDSSSYYTLHFHDS
jgi:hypothetical protein